MRARAFVANAVVFGLLVGEAARCFLAVGAGPRVVAGEAATRLSAADWVALAGGVTSSLAALAQVAWYAHSIVRERWEKTSCTATAK